MFTVFCDSKHRRFKTDTICRWIGYFSEVLYILHSNEVGLNSIII